MLPLSVWPPPRWNTHEDAVREAHEFAKVFRPPRGVRERRLPSHASAPRGCSHRVGPRGLRCPDSFRSDRTTGRIIKPARAAFCAIAPAGPTVAGRSRARTIVLHAAASSMAPRSFIHGARPLPPHAAVRIKEKQQTLRQSGSHGAARLPSPEWRSGFAHDDWSSHTSPLLRVAVLLYGVRKTRGAGK